MSGRILVTGSSGSIGTRLCESFINKNISFVGVDLSFNKWSKEINDCTITADLREQTFASKLPSGIDTVIHLAANSRVNDLIKNPSLALENFVTTFNVLEYARIKKISRFFFASSREVYGNISKDKVREEDVNIDLCESPYSASKIGGEALIQSYCKCFNLDFLVLRFSNVYGMYDESNRVIPVFLKLCKSGNNITVFGRDKILDFVYIDDVINSINTGIEKFDAVKNDIFNIGYGEGISLINLANLIKSSMNAEIEIRVEDNRIGDVMKFVGDISKSNEKLSYRPSVDIKEGIIKAIEWYSIHLK